MKITIRNLLPVLILILGFFAIKKEFRATDTGLFYQLNYIPFGLLILFTLIAISLDKLFYKAYRTKKQFITSTIGILLCCIVVYKIYQRHTIDKSNTLYTFSTKTTLNEYWEIQLKENEKMVLANIDMLGQTLYYGKYTQKGDTITLTDIMKNRYLKQTPVTGIIHQNKIYFKGLDTLGLVQ